MALTLLACRNAKIFCIHRGSLEIPYFLEESAVISASAQRRLIASSALVLVGALGLSACGDDKKDEGSSVQPSSSSSSAAASGDLFAGIQADPALKAKLPAAVQSSGFKVGTDPSYAPNEFIDKDNKTIVGLDIDLGTALGKKLGVPFTFEKASFDAIVPGLTTGKYQLGMSSFTDNKEREKVVDFVTYFTAGSSLLVKVGNPEGLKPDDLSLCGKKVAVEKGTVQLDEVSATVDVAKGLGTRTKKCTDGGKAAPTAQPYPDQSGANLALSSGRADAVLADSPVIAYAAKASNGQFVVSGAAYDTAPYGIAVSKSLGTSKDAILEALKALIADGTYTKVLTKWGVQDGAVTTPVINGAGG
jgi:polar amino acid transport system substrate-binding protein